MFSDFSVYFGEKNITETDKTESPNYKDEMKLE